MPSLNKGIRNPVSKIHLMKEKQRSDENDNGKGIKKAPDTKEENKEARGVLDDEQEDL